MNCFNVNAYEQRPRSSPSVTWYSCNGFGTTAVPPGSGGRKDLFSARSCWSSKDLVTTLSWVRSLTYLNKHYQRTHTCSNIQLWLIKVQGLNSRCWKSILEFLSHVLARAWRWLESSEKLTTLRITKLFLFRLSLIILYHLCDRCSNYRLNLVLDTFSRIVPATWLA